MPPRPLKIHPTGADLRDVTDLQRRGRSADGLRRPAPLDPGVASLPPADLGERRTDVVARTVKAMWRTGRGERRLAPLLERSLDGSARVLHHRRLGDRGPLVDHLVVGPTGLWIVRAMHARGRLSIDRDHRTVVVTAPGSAADRSASVPLVDPVAQQAITDVLTEVGYDWVPLRPAVCVTNLRRWRDRRVLGALVTTPRRLVRAVLARGALTPADMVTVTSALQQRFPNVTG